MLRRESIQSNLYKIGGSVVYSNSESAAESWPPTRVWTGGEYPAVF